ncbi:hypothetical protein C0993_006363 [Termitomyces sp. T159_Od127]|nr:hypothetical protein C0993_006363 [Termitomyces sp. T159_Od127]
MLFLLHNINPNINQRDLTITFSGTGAYLAPIHLCLQPTNDPTLDLSKTRATSTPMASKDDSEDTYSPRPFLDAL